MKAAFPVALIALSLLSGCGGGSSHPNRIASITLSPASASIAVGRKQQFSGTATTNSGQTLTGSAAAATWSSSNSAVATVDQSGLATAVAVGTTTISATIQTGGGPVTGTASLTVTAPTVTSITVTPATASMIAGQTQRLSANAAYSDGSSKDVTSAVAWSSQSQAIATVSSSGFLTAVAAGEDTITASFSGVQGTMSVSVQAIASIAITPATITVWLNATQQLDAIATLKDGSALDVTNTAIWTSSAPASATVANGTVTGVAAGTATVSATAAGVSSSAAVTVSTSNAGITAYDDLTDPRLMTFWPGDGSTISYSGIRNPDGSFGAINSFTSSTADQHRATFTLDDQGRESSAVFSDGTMLAFDWTTPSNPIVTVFPIDRTQVQTFTTGTVLPASGAILNRPGAAMTRPRAATTTSGGTAPTALVSVTTNCGSGPLPEDNARVLVNVAYRLGGSPAPIPARLATSGSGEYEAALPSGPSSLTPAALQSSAAKAFAKLCSVPLPDLEESTLCGPAIETCVTTAKIFKVACGAQTVTNTFFSIANRFNAALPPTVSAVVSLDDNDWDATLETEKAGQYIFQTDPAIECRIDNIKLGPTSLSIPKGSSAPLAATPLWTDSGNVSHLVTSSTLKWSWTPSPADSYLQLAPITVTGATAALANHLGTVLAKVTGNAPTGASPDLVAATETTSGKMGTAAITVTGGLAGTNWAGTHVWTGDPTAYGGPYITFFPSAASDGSIGAASIGPGAPSSTVVINIDTVSGPVFGSLNPSAISISFPFPAGQPCSYTLSGTVSGNTVSGTIQEFAGTCNGVSFSDQTGTFALTLSP